MFMPLYHQHRVRQSLAMFAIAVAALPAFAEEAIILECKGTNPKVETQWITRQFKLESKKFKIWSDLPGGGWSWDKCDPPKPHWSRSYKAQCDWDGDTVSISSTRLGYQEVLEYGEKISINKKTGAYSHMIEIPKSSSEFVGRCEPIPEPVPTPVKPVHMFKFGS